MDPNVLCRCDCSDDVPPEPFFLEDLAEPPSRPREGLVTYSAEITLPLVEPPIRVGEVWHLCPEDGKNFELATLALHTNGMCIRPSNPSKPVISVAWSPFSLVQACRLHTVQADKAQPMLRLFKISVFHHGLTHFFAAQGAEADTQRARWVADVSRSLRQLTQSLFPPFHLRVEPLPGAAWTSTRLLAGYLLLYDELGVSLVYGELHAHWDTSAGFAAYEDDTCNVQVVHLNLDMHTCVSERVGVDCSCFSLGDHHFSTRTCAEKMLWLRAISNVKVKLRHWAANPSPTDMRHYRAAIREQVVSVLPPKAAEDCAGPLLPRRRGSMSRLPRMSSSLTHLAPAAGDYPNAPSNPSLPTLPQHNSGSQGSTHKEPGPGVLLTQAAGTAHPQRPELLNEPSADGGDMPPPPAPTVFGATIRTIRAGSNKALEALSGHESPPIPPAAHASVSVPASKVPSMLCGKGLLQEEPRLPAIPRAQGGI